MASTSSSPGAPRSGGSARAVDHTADVGLELGGPDLPALFSAAAFGLAGLLEGRDEELGAREGPGGEGEEEEVRCAAPDLEALLVAWLRELVHRLSTRPVALAGVVVDEVTDTALSARIRLVASPRPPVREIKGVTYHDLRVRREGPGWAARVIFDV